MFICSRHIAQLMLLDGDYFSKPNSEDIFEAVYAIMQESDKDKFPNIY